MDMQNVSNEMLYEFLRDFRGQFVEFKNDTNRRFEESKNDTNRRFEQLENSMKEFRDETNRRSEDINREIGGLRDILKEDRSKLNELYESRNHVSVSFSRAFVGITLVLSAIVSGFTSLFVSK